MRYLQGTYPHDTAGGTFWVLLPELPTLAIVTRSGRRSAAKLIRRLSGQARDFQSGDIAAKTMSGLWLSV